MFEWGVEWNLLLDEEKWRPGTPCCEAFDQDERLANITSLEELFDDLNLGRRVPEQSEAQVVERDIAN
ncbi:hypothetical protein BGX33_010360 [Mortierella sp. NVP41]|nr:hypothetical protein BGX33_010360 [Mortierella sp. NVP41]